jgi:hypothetical protein
MAVNPIIWLDDIAAQDPYLVGAPAAALARFATTGTRVPNGFVVSESASRHDLRTAWWAVSGGGIRPVIVRHSPREWTVAVGSAVVHSSNQSDTTAAIEQLGRFGGAVLVHEDVSARVRGTLCTSGRGHLSACEPIGFGRPLARELAQLSREARGLLGEPFELEWAVDDSGLLLLGVHGRCRRTQHNSLRQAA